MQTDRKQLAQQIFSKLSGQKEKLSQEFKTNRLIPYFYIDDLLDESLVLEIYKVFPASKDMMPKKSMRENKLVSAQMNQHHPLLEEIIYAFQEPEVVKIIEEITQFDELVPDTQLYAGGISMMEKGNFLKPHLDNSHDMERNNYRVMNLLYYVSPDWNLENGGNLELWHNGIDAPQDTIISKFNRLAVMITHDKSLHSVSEVKVDKNRCCVSNYYFREKPVTDHPYFHVTSFYDTKDHMMNRTVLSFDRKLRNFIRKIFPKGVVKNPHYYDKDKKS
ncbi:MAG: 2OG-Fe(II) oxygenase [Moheibacter sp.]